MSTPRATAVTRIITAGGITRVERRRYQLRAGASPPRAFSADTVGIGSADNNAFTISDSSVSRHHARIEMRDDGVVVHDLGSTNGTYVDGLQIISAFLPESARIRVGQTELSFELTDEVEPLALSERAAFGDLLGQSVAMRRLFASLERIVATDATVLVEGESGTGKEMVAEALHDCGKRSGGPFVIVDCGSLPAGLIESELFGHEKGAFTGAIASRAGAFELADGGTLFLDEIGEIDPALQPRLLRALDRRKVKRVGGSGYADVDVRVVAATNRDLEQMVARGEFREDLYYRLAVVKLRIPPLRERVDDVELLARHFIGQFRARHSSAPAFELTHDIVHALTGRSWRGNVRELRNFIERAVVLAAPELLAPAGDDASTIGGAPGRGGAGMQLEASYADARDRWVGQFEREYVTAALERTGGNVAKAARECQVDRAYLFRLIKKHDLGRK